MTMKSIHLKTVFCSVLLSALFLHSCSLEEYNPGAFTNETLATSTEGYETLINQCYFAMERFYYGAADWMSLTEGDTDLWTYKANQSTATPNGSGFSPAHRPTRPTPITGGTGHMTE